MKEKKNIFIAFILNFVFSIFELIGGFITGSVAITSDAVHDFGDAASIGISYLLERVSNKNPDKKYSYGYARYSVLGGLLVILLLLISSIIVIYNSILRITNPTPVNYTSMIVFAVIGFVVNLVAAYFTHGGKSINQKAVNLHMLEDVFGWLIVLIGSIIMMFTNLYIIDPILSIIVSLFIIVNCFKNLMQILDIFLIKTPKDIDVNELTQNIKNINGVIDIHHLHIWSIDGEQNCATLHVVSDETSSKIKYDVKEVIKKHNISHITIEMENTLEKCEDSKCEINKQISHSNHNHHCNHKHN